MDYKKNQKALVRTIPVSLFSAYLHASFFSPYNTFLCFSIYTGVCGCTLVTMYPATQKDKLAALEPQSQIPEKECQIGP